MFKQASALTFALSGIIQNLLSTLLNLRDYRKWIEIPAATVLSTIETMVRSRRNLIDPQEAESIAFMKVGEACIKYGYKLVPSASMNPECYASAMRCLRVVIRNALNGYMRKTNGRFERSTSGLLRNKYDDNTERFTGLMDPSSVSPLDHLIAQEDRVLQKRRCERLRDFIRHLENSDDSEEIELLRTISALRKCESKAAAARYLGYTRTELKSSLKRLSTALLRFTPHRSSDNEPAIDTGSWSYDPPILPR